MTELTNDKIKYSCDLNNCRHMTLNYCKTNYSRLEQMTERDKNFLQIYPNDSKLI